MAQRGRRPKGTPPPYLCDPSKDIAYSTWQGHTYRFGRHGTPESHALYEAFLREWRQSQRTGAAPAKPGCSLCQLIAAFLPDAHERYRRGDGTPTREAAGFRRDLQALLDRCPDLPADDFGPEDLEAVRQAWIDRGLARKTVNQSVGRVRRLFRWARRKKLISAATLADLQTVDDLAEGYSPAPDHPPIPAARWEDVEAALPWLNRQLRAMVLLQWEVGMRPDEVCALRGSEINRHGLASWKGRTFQAGHGLWVFQPTQHKNVKRGKFLCYVLNAKAQAILSPWLRPDHNAYLFQPGEARRERFAACRTHRTKRDNCNCPGQLQLSGRGRPRPGLRYSTSGYDRAVAVACAKAGVSFTPNQLRHAWFTRVESTPGLGIADASQAGGHASVSTTALYVEQSLRRAAEVARRLA